MSTRISQTPDHPTLRSERRPGLRTGEKARRVEDRRVALGEQEKPNVTLSTVGAEEMDAFLESLAQAFNDYVSELLRAQSLRII